MGTTTLLDFGGLPWVVAEGSCTIDSSACVRSPNFPQVYGHNENCIILVNDTASKSIVVDQFRTEAGYDKLTVNGKSYSGGDGPDDVMPRGRIVWESDGSISKAGWRLCMNDVPTPPPTTAAPTLAPTQVQSAVTWLLAAGGQTCTNACLAQGRTCVQKSWNIPYSSFQSIIGSAADVCTSGFNYPSMGGNFPQMRVADGFCYGYDGSNTQFACDYADGDTSFARFCPCEAATSSPTPRPKTESPTGMPTPAPTQTAVPTLVPTPRPTTPSPTTTPTLVPTNIPTRIPTALPTPRPTTESPTVTTTPAPTLVPTPQLTTASPTTMPTPVPTQSETPTPPNNTLLSAYWDNGECGPEGNNHNWEWCDSWNFKCRKSVNVSTDICSSGRAVLANTKTFNSVGNCTYAYYAQYECEVPDPQLSAYWDYGSCGPHGDNHNWDWCGTWRFRCPEMRPVPTELCASGNAVLVETKYFQKIGNCPYAYYAQYACGGAADSSSKRKGFLAP